MSVNKPQDTQKLKDNELRQTLMMKRLFNPSVNETLFGCPSSNKTKVESQLFSLGRKIGESYSSQPQSVTASMVPLRPTFFTKSEQQRKQDDKYVNLREIENNRWLDWKKLDKRPTQNKPLSVDLEGLNINTQQIEKQKYERSLKDRKQKKMVDQSAILPPNCDKKPYNWFNEQPDFKCE